MSKLEPVDGTAIILHLIEAARALINDGTIDHTLTANVRHWTHQLEERYARERIEAAPVGWEPRRWRDLVVGDRIEVSGNEAVVERAALEKWLTLPPEGLPGDPDYPRSPDSPKYRELVYRPKPYVHSYVAVKLEGRDTTYKMMNPDGEVETLRGPAGRAVDEANGYRSVLGEEPVNVMASWAADAALTLEAAGLGPIEVIR